MLIFCIFFLFFFFFFFFNDTATTEIYTLSLHDALPICFGFLTFAHVLFGKPVPTFPGHALRSADRCALSSEEPAMRLLIVSATVMTLVTILAAATPVHAQRNFASSAGDIAVETVAVGLANPWALAFLPDGRLLVTEKPGRMRIVGKDGKLSAALAGVPAVFARGQGGLHDVVLDRLYAQNGTIYFCFAEPASGGGRTALARAKLVADGKPRLDDVKMIFRQDGPLSSGNHFG